MYKLKDSQHHNDAIEIERCNLERHLRPTGWENDITNTQPTRNLDAIVFSSGASSCGNEVKVTSRHVIDRTAIVASLMPKRRHGTTQCRTRRSVTRTEQNETCFAAERVNQEEVRKGRAEELAGRVAHTKWCVKRTLQLDMGMVGMRPENLIFS